ncbi:MAG: hypothetical protein ACHQ52_08400, partial [Candidatus Eisenbacteria bacterium]
LRFDDAVPMLERLAHAATRLGRRLGVKLTNTLVVRNTRGRLHGERVYLSGPPLHVLAVTVAGQLVAATDGRIPMSFSAGVDAENVVEVLACGFAPVTACTDLLRPTGYRRLPRYLRTVELEMDRLGVPNLASFICRRAGRSPVGDPRPAARANLERYAATVATDPRYAAACHRAEPVRTGPLAAWDCASCNQCVLVCPNGAFFSLPTPPGEHDAPVLCLDGHAVTVETGRWTVRRETQWVLFADACNDCGHCDTFCPERGGPQRVKPRFHGMVGDYEAAAPADGILVERGGRSVRARFDGVEYRMTRDESGARFEDGVIEVTLDRDHRPVATRVIEPREGHRLALARYHQLRLLVDATMNGMNPISARALPAVADVSGP